MSNGSGSYRWIEGGCGGGDFFYYIFILFIYYSFISVFIHYFR